MLFSDYLNAIMLLRRSDSSFVAQRPIASIIELFDLYYLVILNRDYLANRQAKLLLFYCYFNQNYVYKNIFTSPCTENG